MLLTARARDCLFIWNAHAPVARAVGLSDALIDNLRDNVALTELPADEAAVVDYGLELLSSNRVTQAIFDAALAQFGTRGLVELNSLIGCYTMLALNMNAFDVQLPDGTTEKRLPVWTNKCSGRYDRLSCPSAAKSCRGGSQPLPCKIRIILTSSERPGPSESLEWLDRDEIPRDGVRRLYSKS